MADDTFSSVGRLRDVLERLEHREPSTELEAQAVIEGIRAEKGYLDEEILRDLNNVAERSRQQILRIVEQKRESEAEYTKSVSEQLYSSKFRFLYELIQNADDSHFERAKGDGIPQFLRFRITPTTFIFETNEDGFTRANIDAICATGKSSKKASASDNHIGEKGFGFKSVFSVADEVHVQSGLWSFCFKHKQGENGLGMVTPLDAPYISLPPDITTRMTLHLSNTSMREYQRLLGALTDLPDTTIFFLQKLQKIEIDTTQSTSSSPEYTVIRKYVTESTSSTRMVNLTRIVAHTQDHEEIENKDEKKYHVFTHLVDGLPEEPRRRGRTRARIELAFPVNIDGGQPELSELGQHVFAYLPLQRLPQIQFLIQSDFITSASRESVVDCAWNDAIRDGVAEAFARAVKTFANSEHPLRYSWLEYLPTSPMEHLWQPLYQSIQGLLRTMPIIQTWEQRRFKKPSEVFRLLPVAIHEGAPLFRDLSEEIYLAPEYDSKHFDTLKNIGTANIHWDLFIDRLQQDLVRSDSYLKTKAYSDLWHQSCATSLLAVFNPRFRSREARIKRLAIIPLIGGNKWTGAPHTGSGSLSKLYFPTTEGVDIPEDVSLHLVERKACLNSKRKALYEALGVEECPRETVFTAIENFHKSHPKTISYASHFQYLFHFHSQPELLRPWIYVPIHCGYLKPIPEALYFPSEQEYDTEELLPETVSGKDKTAQLLRKDFVAMVGPSVRYQNLSWKEWLERATGARYHPPLVEKAPGVLRYKVSKVLRAVLEQNSQKFVGTMRAHWAEYKSDVHHVKSELRECKVPCNSGELFPLQSTYLPTPQVVSKLSSLGVESGFPLLKVPQPIDESNQIEWRFLEELGVHFAIDLNFYEVALSKIVQLIGQGRMAPERAKQLYINMTEVVTMQDSERLRTFFNSSRMIAYPNHGATLFLFPKDCVWAGPEFLNVKSALEHIYGGDRHLEAFFKVYLEIRDFTYGDLLDELKCNRDRTMALPTCKMEEIYKYLDDNIQAEADWQEIRDAFGQRELVMDSFGEWHTLRTCLWNSPFALEGYVDLSNVYPNLREFFTRRLKVTAASPSMLIKQLQKMSDKAEPQINEIHRRLIEVGRIIAKTGIDDKISKALRDLSAKDFWPKRDSDGEQTLVGGEDEFFICDHKRYGDAFADQAVLLDLTLEESCILNTVFEHLRLTDRYLSNAVREVSTVGEGVAESDSLTKEFRVKAYALYCCAARYKSVKALRGERGLFDLLSETKIYAAGDISTSLELGTENGPIRVQSDRLMLHHELSDGQLKVYVPDSPNHRRTCYRSQLPHLLASILNVTFAAAHPIFLILNCDYRDIDDILCEHDIERVDWINPPVIDGPSPSEDETPATPRHTGRPSEPIVPETEPASAPSTPRGRLFTPESSVGHDGSSSTTSNAGDARAVSVSPSSPTPAPAVPPSAALPPRQYEVLVDHVVRSAQRASYRQQRPYASAAQDTPPADDTPSHDFNHTATFGNRDANEMAHDRKVGAAGEAYVFELLSGLSLPGFGRENWRSTIRGELQRHSRYADMDNWLGRETADIVYKDTDGSLTRYLRAHCFGGFPDGIGEDRDFTAQPIEYFLEVKTTTSGCHARFFMSNSQYQRMQRLNVPIFGAASVNKIYIIFRVFNLLSPRDVDCRIFVDPFRFRGRYIDFEVYNWTGKVRDGE